MGGGQAVARQGLPPQPWTMYKSHLDCRSSPSSVTGRDKRGVMVGGSAIGPWLAGLFCCQVAPQAPEEEVAGVEGGGSPGQGSVSPAVGEKGKERSSQ